VCLCISVGVYSWCTPCNTDSIAVGTVQCYQHSMCNICILSLHLHTCWISEAVHSGRNRLLVIVVSEELTAAVCSVIVCGKTVHLFMLAEYTVFLLSAYLLFVTSLYFWTVGWFGYVNTINETTGSDKVQLIVKIITACLNTLTHWHANKQAVVAKCPLQNIVLAGAEDVGWKGKSLFVHKMCNQGRCSLWSELFSVIDRDC
jgi:hypothetical protein